MTTTTHTKPSDRLASALQTLRDYWPFLLSLVALGVLWELNGGGTRALLLPKFSTVAAGFVEIIANGTLLPNLWLSFVDLVIGFSIAVVGGVAIGLVIGRFKVVEDCLDAYLSIGLITPIVALVPLVVIFFKYDMPARLVVIILFSMPIIALNSSAGVRGVPPSLVEMGTSFLASERDLLLKVILPGALPGIMSGIRLGFGRALLGTLVSEWLLAAYALGEMIVQMQGRNQTAQLYATVLTILVCAVLLTRLVDTVEKRLTRWKRNAAFE